MLAVLMMLGKKTDLFQAHLKVRVMYVCFAFCMSGSSNFLHLRGHYEGTLAEFGSWTLRDGKRSSINRELVSVEVSPVVGRDAQSFELTDVNKTPLLSFEIQEKVGFYKRGVALKFSRISNSLMGREFNLIQDKKVALSSINQLIFPREKCFSVQTDFQVRFCVSDRDFYLEMHQNEALIYRLRAGKFSERVAFSLEEPKDYTINELIRLSFDKSINSKIEFEYLMQSHLTARAALENLIPHMSVTTGLSLASGLTARGFPIPIFNDLSDLAPFLLPTRWIQASEADHQYRAQIYGFVIARANVTTAVESLSYSYLFDLEVMKVYDSLILQVNEMQSFIQSLADAKLSEPDAWDILNTLVSELISQRTELAVTASADRIALTQAVGFLNPEAIRSLVLDSESRTISEARHLDLDLVKNKSVERSTVLNQLNELLKATHGKNVELFFSWMDPYGNPFQRLGVNWEAQLKSSASQEAVLREQKTLTIQQIEDNSSRRVLIYNSMIDSYRALVGKFRSYENLLKNRYRELVNLSKLLQSSRQIPPSSLVPVSARDIRTDYLKFAKAYFELQNELTQFRTNRALIERMILANRFDPLYLDSPEHKGQADLTTLESVEVKD